MINRNDTSDVQFQSHGVANRPTRTGPQPNALGKCLRRPSFQSWAIVVRRLRLVSSIVRPSAAFQCGPLWNSRPELVFLHCPGQSILP